ncbi:MAG: DUF2933 domain-containing protein [Pseudomonadota bacterium]|jgi:hypothetical protein
MDPQAQHHQPARRWRWAFFGFAAIAAFLFFSEHRAHALGLLPWLLLAACPLMHLFVHGGHGHGRGGAGSEDSDREQRP